MHLGVEFRVSHIFRLNVPSASHVFCNNGAMYRPSQPSFWYVLSWLPGRGFQQSKIANNRHRSRLLRWTRKPIITCLNSFPGSNGRSDFKQQQKCDAWKTVYVPKKHWCEQPSESSSTHALRKCTGNGEIYDCRL
jgi:hypothetical protein